MAGRLAEQAQVVEQSGNSGLMRVPRIDPPRIRAAKIHPNGSAGRQTRIHGVDDQQLLTAANLRQQICSHGAAIDEACHRSDARIAPQPANHMNPDSVIGQQQIPDADDGDRPRPILIAVST
jgi:hypothetical protein